MVGPNPQGFCECFDLVDFFNEGLFVHVNFFDPVNVSQGQVL